MVRLFVLLFSGILPSFSYAAVSAYENEESFLPRRPSAPPSLRQRVPIEFPHCERYFVYQGRKLECDSNLGKDADRLRPIMQDVPSALNELDIYQENRQKLKLAAYVGTGGFLAILLGFVISHPLFDKDNGSVQPGGYLAIGGAVIGINSFIYGLSVVRGNEKHIGTAVNNYNTARPDDPIELQFSTHVNF